jgi:hypothetical protein
MPNNQHDRQDCYDRLIPVLAGTTISIAVKVGAISEFNVEG